MSNARDRLAQRLLAQCRSAPNLNGHDVVIALAETLSTVITSSGDATYAENMIDGVTRMLQYDVRLKTELYCLRRDYRAVLLAAGLRIAKPQIA